MRGTGGGAGDGPDGGPVTRAHGAAVRRRRRGRQLHAALIAEASSRASGRASCGRLYRRITRADGLVPADGADGDGPSGSSPARWRCGGCTGASSCATAPWPC